MPTSAPSPGGVAAALARWAGERPEAPFLFYRNAKGHFRWWSFATACAFLEPGAPGLGGERLSVKGVVVEREAGELLGGFLRAALDSPEEGLWMEGPGARTDRDVWISWRPLRDPAELALARWAIVAGAAILVEPGSSLHPELFAWARPTIASGSVEGLLGLADQLSLLAPRFLRRRWLRQRGERLRLLWVEGQPTALELQQVTETWRPLAPQATIDAFRFAQRIQPVAPRQGAES